MAARQNEIKIGSRDNPYLTLDNSDIITVNGNLSCDLLCEEIPIDTLEIQCRYDRLCRVYAPKDYIGLQSADGLSFRSREGAAGDVLEIPYADGLWYHNDGKYIGKFYVADAKRTGKRVYTITAQSAMGVLDGLSYYGKILLGSPLADVVNDIILTDGLRETKTPFLTELAASVAYGDGLSNVKVTGWIPVCSKREALHHVLFAQGLNIFKSEDDAFLISRVSTAASGEIDPIWEYDSGSVDLTSRVKTIEVTEHSFVENPNAEEVVLYDNTEDAVDMEAVVSFDSAPIDADTVKATGTIRILAKNENCALITGVGTLVGKPYAATSHTLLRTSTALPDGESVTVSDATLVNAVNSNAVADRLFAYYTQRRPMQIPIVLSGERCGLKYGCVTPYGDKVTAYIASMAIQASAIAKADCKMVSGWTPLSGSGEFKNVKLLTGSGTFYVPAAVRSAVKPRIRIVLIGGGSGGWSGERGEDGPDGVVETIDDLAKPGNPGKNGESGKIYIADISGSAVKSSYAYKCGAGGAGGKYSAAGSVQGAAGTATTFGDKTSQYGHAQTAGYLDILTGKIYGGLPPDYSGVLSGCGGGCCIDPGEAEMLLGYYYEAWADSGQYVVNEDALSGSGARIGDILHGESGSWGDYKTWGDYTGTRFAHAYGGAPGGGPVTSLQSDKKLCSGSDTYVSGSNIYLGDGGNGADGLNAPAPRSINPLAYGQGGIGGMGGGGGGGAGCIANSGYDFEGYDIVSGSGGAGGKGGAGSAGAPGCILVYY